MFYVFCFVITSSLVAAIPLSHRVQDPLDRRISLDKLLDTKASFTRAALDYYLDILDDYEGSQSITD